MVLGAGLAHAGGAFGTENANTRVAQPAEPVEPVEPSPARRR